MTALQSLQQEKDYARSSVLRYSKEVKDDIRAEAPLLLSGKEMTKLDSVIARIVDPISGDT